MAEGIETDSDDVVGQRIRALRQAKSMTLKELGALTGLSHSFISQLERGKARPSLGTLQRIGRALGFSTIDVVTERVEPAPSAAPVVRSGQVIRGTASGAKARMLLEGDAPFNAMELVYKDSGWGDYFVHREDEFVYVVSGGADIDLAERGVYHLDQGESLYYEGGTPHRWASTTEHGVQLIVIKQRIGTDDHVPE